MTETSNHGPLQDLGAVEPKLATATEKTVVDECKSVDTPGISTFYIDPVKERKLMRKFDFYAIGLLGLFYMSANLDRSNIGNAKVAGMDVDIGLVGNQFGTATTLLFATYVPFETPVAVLLKIVGAKPLLSVCAFSWGIACLGMGFIQDYKGLYACRLLIGAFEAGLIPCINVYLGLVYKKEERAKRSAVIFAFSACSSAFGGILAYGLCQLRGPGNFEGWRWLFVVEGLITIVLVPAFWFLFPTSPVDAWFLGPEEKQIMRARYDNDPHWGYDEKFSWTEVIKVVKDPKWYCFWIYQFSINISLYSFTTFLPSIISGLGYHGVKANLMTVPIYFWGMCWCLFIAWASDRSGYRGPFIAFHLLVLIIGYSILVSVKSLGVRYFGCFVVATAIYANTGTSLMWLNDNVARHFKRATMLGATTTLANTAGVAVGQIFTSDSAPRYLRGMYVAMGMAGVAFLAIVGMMIGIKVVNKRRREQLARAEEAGNPIPPQPELGDSDPHFIYKW
ncbi:hypothetical protein AYO21_04136 [Fonsecaea monophora]|uniref:Major facilitator superfamily (MFS) profile domain-containing protein n=1 Tax=Fonsecaea monophora TaxID=254056 RepID=A0A177FE07_9EURO|nr:hypothetical protein AYO21_04136 [Fonsecaea monophora]KAH0844940.1 putative transporter [Fonsecaea pedrosoi]OAG41672.1 hypothetical protein AYO21_04136 [Fonsecaea monophora]